MRRVAPWAALFLHGELSAFPFESPGTDGRTDVGLLTELGAGVQLYPLVRRRWPFLQSSLFQIERDPGLRSIVWFSPITVGLRFY